MNLVVFLNGLGLGGTEKAAGIWAGQLARDPSFTQVRILSLADGPRRQEWGKQGLAVQVVAPHKLPDFLAEAEVIHAHAPGFPHAGDVLGDALKRLGRKIPVVQTNIFGKLENPKENQWTDSRLFISWTSCVQAARRSGRKLDADFFRRQSVASYPLAPLPIREEAEIKVQALALRESLGISPEHILFGRFSRPEPNKWDPMMIPAFLDACRKNPHLRLLLREPPIKVAHDLISAGWVCREGTSASRPILILQATPDSRELAVSQMACDAILHISRIGESFGYGIAEPMNLGKPAIVNSVPWHDQAQIELVRHGESGLLASTRNTLTRAILQLSESRELRDRMGESSRAHIRALADPGLSVMRLKTFLRCAREDLASPWVMPDIQAAGAAASYLDAQQFGHGLLEQTLLRCHDWRARAGRIKYKLGSPLVTREKGVP